MTDQVAPDVLARARRRRVVEIVAGIALTAAAVVTVGLVYATFRGTFGDAVRVTAGITDAGDSLEPGDAVIYRDIIVGEVRSAAASSSSGARVSLTIKASYAKVIPDNVQSIAVPINLFGSTAVQLIPPQRPSGRPLRPGGHIAADRSPAATGLQSALTDAYKLLTAVRPADLDAALTALSTALAGRGDDLGRLLDKADLYLRRLTPSLPDLEAVIANLATVSKELAADTPAMLDTVRNLLGSARTVVARSADITKLFAVAPAAVDHANGLVAATADSFVTVVNAQQAVLDAFRDNPQALPKTIAGFKAFADSFSSTLTSGPWQNVNVLATGVNSAALGPLLLGQKTQVLSGVTDPRLYTADQCPRYPGMDGPNCTTTGTSFGGSVTSVGHSSEVAAMRTLVSSLTGVPPASVPNSDDLLIGPLLRGSETVVW
jgi:phospholipid/cholesterol/gamma-HCH transport system substrate-binding protein